MRTAQYTMRAALKTHEDQPHHTLMTTRRAGRLTPMASVLVVHSTCREGSEREARRLSVKARPA